MPLRLARIVAFLGITVGILAWTWNRVTLGTFLMPIIVFLLVLLVLVFAFITTIDVSIRVIVTVVVVSEVLIRVIFLALIDVLESFWTWNVVFDFISFGLLGLDGNRLGCIQSNLFLFGLISLDGDG